MCYDDCIKREIVTLYHYLCVFVVASGDLYTDVWCARTCGMAWC